MTQSVLYLLPGLLCDATIWAPQIAAFRANYDVRVADYGDLNSLQAMAALVLAQAPARFSLAGHSMGGRVALQIVQAAPERVARLALLDTGTHAARPSEPQSRGVLLALAEREGMRALAEQWLPPMVHPSRHADASLMEPLFAMVEQMTPVRFRHQIAALLSRPDATPWLHRISCPTLIAVGAEDGWSPPEQHAAMAAAIPGARCVVLRDSGHMVPAEAPDALNEAMAAWLTVAEHPPLRHQVVQGRPGIGV